MSDQYGSPEPRTIRDATVDVLRGLGLTTVFANPGSTEVPFLTDLPTDLRFVLALHEGSVVGMATGWAVARDRPALVQLHTTAGLGNAVGALATARVNRAPLVVLVGQQDRRHLDLEPFLTGRLRDLAGSYPVRVEEPVTAQEVPAAVARAHHTAADARGPALVIVPMDDWSEPCDEERVHAAAGTVVRAQEADSSRLAGVAGLLDTAENPALVAGAGTDTEEGWAALTALAEHLGARVFQESFGARAGFPQDHPLYAGVLPADRPGLRDAFADHDVVLAAGAPVFRQYPYTSGPLVPAGTRVALLTDDPEEAYRSPVETAVVAPVASAVRGILERTARRTGPPRTRGGESSPAPPGENEPLSPSHVLAALAQRASPETVFVEETPSSRPEMHRLIPARRPLGFVSAAMGGLGFALPAATGIRMADPERPVIAVVGDGSSMYAVQALWSAARYSAGVLFVVLSNGGYAVMDRLAEQQGGTPSWPSFPDVSVAGVARELGCPAHCVDTYAGLVTELDEAVPHLEQRQQPLVLSVTVDAQGVFRP
ncbi:benzoylformate decarboxylase [Haloactinospora alba]|uniref:Benzoylformate decarboxylase n=1 Tax=Haloactinospora alba TaxID=405555 RepID=A0A543NH16_9ACTN|nr:thiamine pyrophosphate-dependent enzyme [Haloactinospora alba]TQN31138.1 benzoylformate decarboxylase [Haloactinospora alba]